MPSTPRGRNARTRPQIAGSLRKIRVKPGTLDDTSWLTPSLHIWTKSKQPWVPILEEVRCFDGQP